MHAVAVVVAFHVYHILIRCGHTALAGSVTIHVFFSFSFLFSEHTAMFKRATSDFFLAELLEIQAEQVTLKIIHFHYVK